MPAQLAFSCGVEKRKDNFMNHHTLSMAAYWRNSLADAELGKGCWYDIDSNSSHIRPRIELNNAALDRKVTDDLFRTEASTTQSIEIAFYPLMFKLKIEHGSRKQYALPLIITPVVVKAVLHRSGSITPTGKTFIARDLLEPLDKHSFSVGHIDDLDAFLTNHPSPVPGNILRMANLVDTDSHSDDSEDLADNTEKLTQIWKYLLAYCDSMLDHVCRDDAINSNGYLRAREWMVRKIGGMDAPARRITSLYDHYRQNLPATPLLSTLSSVEPVEPISLLDENASLCLHAGHCSDRYPLAPAQRDAINHVLHMDEGEILAVNGPPGTGKTTLLISVVASLWVKAALEQSDPPLIVASSTNNQSVTNILDAFAKDIATGTGPFSGRWISAVNQYGVYMSSRSRKMDVGEKYLSPDYFLNMESVDGIAQARDQFLERARAAFPDLVAPSVSTVVKALHKCIADQFAHLSGMHESYEQWTKLQSMLSRALGDNPWDTLQRFDVEAEQAKQRARVFENAYINLVNHLGAEPFWYDMLRFIPSVSKRQGVRASIVVKRSIKGIDPHKIWSDVGTLKDMLKQKLAKLKSTQEKTLYRQRKAHSLVKHLSASRRRLSESYQCVMDLESSASPKEPATLLQANQQADTRVRFNLFQMATHYWEGRWLLEVDGQEARLLETSRKQDPETVKNRWRRRMMLTPCAVSTFYMLPGEFRVLHDNDHQKPDYLYNHIDLLIVDEAGQVLPEVAGASFALAKKAMVIGDTLQIEPIWNIPKSVDVGNLIQHRVCINNDDAISEIRSQGKMASSGNVMSMAQHASRYHYDADMPRGMFLYEHRRCFNEIIAYCNALSYKNKLIPARGRREDLPFPPNSLPAMGYINVSGICKTKASGTRFNPEEASTIAQWIISQQSELERLYARPIEKIIGIVTPFTGQVEAIRNQCRSRGLDVSLETGITIGTVHALQGAERPIVLFSPTYSKSNSGQFIDASPSMLNVAVSRARDNFILVGDMRLMNPKLGFTPSGLLASFLLRKEENEINFQISGFDSL